jgi:hypothetical protein
LSAVRDCLCNIFAAVGGHSSIRNLRTVHAMVIGTQVLCKDFLFKVILSLGRIFYDSIFTALDNPLTNADCLNLALHILSEFILFYYITVLYFNIKHGIVPKV